MHPGLAVGADKFGAVLADKTCGIHFVPHPQTLEQGVATGQQGFANPKTREFIPFHQAYRQTLFRQECRGGTAGGACADDHCIHRWGGRFRVDVVHTA